ncbi:hypothetical protein [Streptomyces sp. NPDC086777]
MPPRIDTPSAHVITGRPVHAGEIGPGDPCCAAMHGDHPHRAPTEERA